MNEAEDERLDSHSERVTSYSEDDSDGAGKEMESS